MKWYLGANSFAMIMEQDRKHWLLKTDRTKQVQDTITGDMFKGRIDNMGSDIVIETEKSYTQDAVVHNATFSSENVADVFDLASSVFPFIPEMNGLHFLRLKSINLKVNDEYHNFRLKLTNVTECYIPMAPDASDPDVFSYKWYRTTDTPVLEAMDGNGQWTIHQNIEFDTGVTNPVYYYPADDVLMPVEIDVTGTTLTTSLITDQDMIGYPLVWFTCDEANLGPKITLADDTIPSPQSGTLILSMGHAGNVSMYTNKLYPAVGVESDTVPTDTLSEWKLVCENPAEGVFDGTISDFTKRIKSVLLTRYDDTTTDQQYIRFINEKGNNRITMNMEVGWTYDSNTNSYFITMNNFASNLYGTSSVLIPAFDVKLDESIPFENTTNDTGFAGMSFGSSKQTEDRYPHDLVNLEGLPQWLKDPEANASSQRMSIYAVHNTPFYNPSDQSTRQIAGLIMDPGVERTYDSNFHPGEYRIDNVTIMSGGTGYNHMMDERVVVYGYYHDAQFYREDTYTTLIEAVAGKMYVDIPTYDRYWYNATDEAFIMVDRTQSNVYGNNRFWLQLNDGSKSRTLFGVTSIDWVTGAATRVDPLYHESDENVMEMVYGYYDAEKNEFFTDYTELVPIECEQNKVYYATNVSSGIQVFGYGISTHTFTPLPGYDAGSAYEETYNTKTITGQNMITQWLCDNSVYTTDALMTARLAQLNGTGTGAMANGEPWWLYTYTTGTGLVIAVDENNIVEMEAPFTSDDVPTEQIGRVYVLSNDSPVYQNNKTAKNPKPERTIARICDIPISVMQLSNIHGLAPTSVVDKKYIRSEATFTENDLNYIMNDSKSRWVRPTALNASGNPVYSGDPEGQSNAFIFDSMELLNTVDLIYHNDFREITNLNRSVNPDDVSVAVISEAGSRYQVGSTGTIVVGGYSFTYEVMSVGASGNVTSVEIGSNDDPDARINLANFDMASDETLSGLTVPYGTAPNVSENNSYGTGLKVRLQIANYADLVPKKGNVFTDLYAFVSDFDGIWLATRKNNQWIKNTQLAATYKSEVNSSSGEVSLRDSYMNSILPSARVLPVAPMSEYQASIGLNAFVTASSINVVDTKCTPVHVPSTAASSETDMYDDLTVIDINKLYCDNWGKLSAASHSEAAVLESIRATGAYRFDSYIFWRWENEQDTSCVTFVYGVIHRSLDNLQSNDSTSTLPGNELVTPQYVHTNTQTTIMWNVPHVGPMVWMFDPYSTVHEKYYVNAHTRELYVTREPLTWDEIEIWNSAHTKLNIVNNGAISYNIYTNNPAYVAGDTSKVIYQQPNYAHIIKADQVVSENVPTPMGSWRLVFPSINTTGTYKLKTTEGTDVREFTPVRMTLLRGSNIGNTIDVLNADGDPVNYKTLLVDENTTTSQIDLRLYDQETHRWENV